MTMGAVPDPSDVPNLRYVHFSVAGIDHVAHKELLHQANMAVTTSTGAPAIAVAEWVFGTILGHFRQLFKFKEWQAAKVWGSLGPDTPTSTLDNKTMGIVGYGSIGRQGGFCSLISFFAVYVVCTQTDPFHHSCPGRTSPRFEDCGIQLNSATVRRRAKGSKLLPARIW